MYNPDLETLIDAALADGELTEKEKQILFKKAQAMGVDLDEFEMVLDARLVKLKKAEQERAASSAPKSNKLGDVKKCPACGAMVQSYQGICPECGYAFENTDANSAVKELSSLLQKEADTVKMEKIIDSYPIPMDKASLLAFVTWLRPQSTDTGNPLANAYYKKYAECVNKIKVSFANDKELSPFIAHFAEDEKKIKKQKIINYTIKNSFFWIGIVLLIPLYFILRPTPTYKSIEKTSIAIDKAIKKGDTQKAVDIFLEFEGKGKYKGKWQLAENGTAESVVNACLSEDNFKDAKRVGDAAGADYHSNNIFDSEKAQKRIANKLYEYSISHGDFESAKEIILSSNEYDTKGTYVKDVVTYMCEHGQKEEAQKFLNTNAVNISSYDNLYKSGNGDPTVYVKKIIQGIIDQY